MDCAEIEISKLYTPTSTAVSLSEEQFPSFEQLLITDVQSSNDPTNSIGLLAMYLQCFNHKISKSDCLHNCANFFMGQSVMYFIL